MTRHAWKIASVTLTLLFGIAGASVAGYIDLTPNLVPNGPLPEPPPDDPVVTGTWSTANPIMNSRLFRDGNPSVYTSQKLFPGIIVAPARYATYDGPSLTNTFLVPGILFVSLSDPSGTMNSTFVSAYLGAFVPNSLSTNYLGDAGNSGDGTSFSVLVPVGGSVTLVANTIGGINASPPLGATYSISYFFLPLTTVPEPSSVALLVTGLVGVAGNQVRRRRRLRV